MNFLNYASKKFILHKSKKFDKLFFTTLDKHLSTTKNNRNKDEELENDLRKCVIPEKMEEFEKIRCQQKKSQVKKITELMSFV